MAVQPHFTAVLGQRPDAADIGLAFGRRDGAAGIEQVEQMAGLQALVIGRQRDLGLQGVCTFLFGVLKVGFQHLDIGDFEIIFGIFLFGLQEDVAVKDAPLFHR